MLRPSFGNSSAGSASTRIVAIKCRRKRLQWRVCNGHGKSCSRMHPPSLSVFEADKKAVVRLRLHFHYIPIHWNTPVIAAAQPCLVARCRGRAASLQAIPLNVSSPILGPGSKPDSAVDPGGPPTCRYLWLRTRHAGVKVWRGMVVEKYSDQDPIKRADRRHWVRLILSSTVNYSPQVGLPTIGSSPLAEMAAKVRLS